MASVFGGMPLFRRPRLPESVPGALWLASMPGRRESWLEFLRAAEAHRIVLALCLTPLPEIARLSPPYHDAATSGRLPFRWRLTPMQDFGLPQDDALFRAGVVDAGAVLQRGDAVLLHCAAGIGRTGTAAACLLKHLGLPADQALQRIRDAGSNPETALQSGLVHRF